MSRNVRNQAHAAKRAVADWSWYYSIEPKIAATFVERRRKGTSYRAANWSEIGTTSGYAKVGASHHNSQKAKTIFVYGFNRQYRRLLMTALRAVAPI